MSKLLDGPVGKRESDVRRRGSGQREQLDVFLGGDAIWSARAGLIPEQVGDAVVRLLASCLATQHEAVAPQAHRVLGPPGLGSDGSIADSGGGQQNDLRPFFQANFPRAAVDHSR